MNYIKKTALTLPVFLLSLLFCSAEEPITDDQVKDLVKLTCEAIAKDTPTTFTKINAGEAPYIDKVNKDLYVFVYNESVKIVSHPKAALVGTEGKGKPDVKGKLFRDLIVEGAVKNGEGWEDYHYKKPTESGMYPKTVYYKMVKGSDGVNYIVICGKYK